MVVRNVNEPVAPPRILLVEDEAPLQHALARVLEASGYRVQMVGSAAEAVSAALAERPDVLLLDVNLPDDTGWGVLRQLARAGISCRELPTIVISAGQPAPRRIDEFRPRAFLAKPFPVDTLKRLIVEALAGSHDAASEDRDMDKQGDSSNARW